MYLKSSEQLQNGDLVEVVGPLPFPRHVGIYAEGRGFIHNSKGQCVLLTTREAFAGNNPIRVLFRVKGNWIQKEQAVQRALSLLGTPYDLLKFNCEHTAYYALTGAAKSPQLGLAVLVGLFVVGLWIASNR